MSQVLSLELTTLHISLKQYHDYLSPCILHAFATSRRFSASQIFTGMLEGCAKICLDPNFPPPPGTDWPEVEEVEYSDLWDKVYPN
jgi:hypothetical protein